MATLVDWEKSTTSHKANSCPQNIGGVHGNEMVLVDSETASGQD